MIGFNALGQAHGFRETGKCFGTCTSREVRGPASKFVKPARGETILRFLEADDKVPVGGKPLDLLKDKTVPRETLAAARLFYETVNRHMRYSKEGKGWGQGDAVWACDSKYGNCTDFHSLFIALARAHKIPGKFEIGCAQLCGIGHTQMAGNVFVDPPDAYEAWAKEQLDARRQSLQTSDASASDRAKNS